MGSYVEKRISNRDRLLMVEEYVNAALMENRLFTAGDVARAICDGTDYIDYKSIYKYIYDDLAALQKAGYVYESVPGRGYRIVSRPDKIGKSDIDLLNDCINGADAMSDLEKDALKYKISKLGTKQDEHSSPMEKKIAEIYRYIGEIEGKKHLNPKIVRIEDIHSFFVDVRDYPFVNEVTQTTYTCEMVPYAIEDGYYLFGYFFDDELWASVDIRGIISIEYVDDFRNRYSWDLDKSYRIENAPVVKPGENPFLKKDEPTYDITLRIPKMLIKNYVNHFGRPDKKRNYRFIKYIIKDDPSDVYSCLVVQTVIFAWTREEIIRWSLGDKRCIVLGPDEAIKAKEKLLSDELAKMTKPV